MPDTSIQSQIVLKPHISDHVYGNADEIRQNYAALVEMFEAMTSQMKQLQRQTHRLETMNELRHRIFELDVTNPPEYLRELDSFSDEHP